MANAGVIPSESAVHVRSRITVPAALAFVITMLVCVVLGWTAMRYDVTPQEPTIDVTARLIQSGFSE